MDYSAYGKTFNDKRTLDAYKKMQSQKRTKALARRKDMSKDERERAEIRKHFGAEAKHFNI